MKVKILVFIKGLIYELKLFALHHHTNAPNPLSIFPNFITFGKTLIYAVLACKIGTGKI
jgi:hypothetical protein